MKEFVSHIDFLVQKHDCVIIPDFGGFVISHESSIISHNGSILPPKVSVGFNPSLRHNDGLLAESYMSMYSISYDEACLKIEEAVNRLNIILSMKHPVQVGRLGKLLLNDNNRLEFVPNEKLTIFHPDTFGLSTVNIKRLTDLEVEEEKVKRKSLARQIFVGIGASAAAVLMFFALSTPISDSGNIQKSSFFIDLVSSMSMDQEVEGQAENIEAPIVDVTEVNKMKEPAVVEERVDSNYELNDSKNSFSGSYYVIVGGGTQQGEVQNIMDRLEAEGMKDLGTIISRDRIRIYVASFETRSEAERYLQSFKKENPQISDAWVYHKN